jgi:type II secretion system protein H
MRPTSGFTFIELCVVLVLAGLMTALALPRFNTALFTDDLKTSVRRLAGTVRVLKNDAVRERTRYRLHLDMTSGRVWYDSKATDEDVAAPHAAQLPEGIHILDVEPAGGETITDGESIIHIDPKGYVQPAAIHVGSDDGDVFTLVLTPFLEKIGIVTGYVSFEDR